MNYQKYRIFYKFLKDKGYEIPFYKKLELNLTSKEDFKRHELELNGRDFPGPSLISKVLKKLPEGIDMTYLTLDGMENIRDFPPDMKVKNLDLKHMYVNPLPKNYHLKKLTIDRSEFPHGLGENIEIDTLRLLGDVEGHYDYENIFLSKGLKIRHLEVVGAIINSFPTNMLLDTVVLRDVRGFNEFPENFCSPECSVIYLEWLFGLKTLPENLSADQITILNTPNINAITSDMNCLKLSISQMKNLRVIEKNVNTKTYILFKDLYKLIKLPDYLESQRIIIDNLGLLTYEGMPKTIKAQSLTLDNLPKLEKLPEGIIVDNLILSFLPNLKVIPETIQVKNAINMSSYNAKTLTQYIPEHLKGKINITY